MRILLLLVSWLIVGFGQPAWISWFAPIAAGIGYALFWQAIKEIHSSFKRFFLGTLWFSCVQAVQLSWMTATEFQGLYIFGVYFALSIWIGLQFGLVSLTVSRWPHLAVAGLWTLFEWGRLHFLCGFSWNPIGLSLTAYTAPLQMASLFGVLGLSFWVILTNLAAFHRKWIAFGTLAIFPYIFGWIHIQAHRDALEKSPRLSVGLVQTGLLPSEKIPLNGRAEEFISPYEQWRRIFQMVKDAQTKFDLIVLPEYAVPVPAETTAYSAHIVGKILTKILGEAPVSQEARVTNLFWGKSLANAFSTEVIAGFDSHEEERHFAAAYYTGPKAIPWQRYEKRVLVPLAEYIPFAWLKKFTAAYGITQFFTPGTQAKLFRGETPLSVSICYEETFSHHMREGRLEGAELFVNITNDNWYPSSKLPRQHFDHGRIRTVENGVPLVRSCNTGVTAAIDSLGRTIAAITQERTREVLAVLVPKYHYRTLYTLWGDWGIVILSFGSILLVYLKQLRLCINAILR